MTTNNKDFKVKNGIAVTDGGTFGGPVTVGEPTDPSHAVTLGYLDGLSFSGAMVVSETPPGSASAGDIWFDSTSGGTFVYYDSYWIQIMSSTGPQGEQGIQGEPGEGVSGVTATAAELNILDGATLTTTELNYVDGVTSSIQSQLNSKQDVVGGVSSTEIGYLANVTSDIQEQLATKADLLSPTITMANLVSANSSIDPLTISTANAHGGTGYAGLMKLENASSGATNTKKFVRLNSTGQLEIINDAYTATLMYLSDGGNFGTSGTITPGAYTAGQTIKTTIWSASDMGFTSTYTQATNSYTTIASKTYTPASSSSYIFVEVYARYSINGAAEDSFFSQLTWAGNEFAAQRQVWINGAGGGTRSSTLFPLAGRITNGSLTGYTLAINARRDSADDTLTVYADGAFNVKITEVAR